MNALSARTDGRERSVGGEDEFGAGELPSNDSTSIDTLTGTDDADTSEYSDTASALRFFPRELSVDVLNGFCGGCLSAFAERGFDNRELAKFRKGGPNRVIGRGGGGGGCGFE